MCVCVFFFCSQNVFRCKSDTLNEWVTERVESSLSNITKSNVNSQPWPTLNCLWGRNLWNCSVWGLQPNMDVWALVWKAALHNAGVKEHTCVLAPLRAETPKAWISGLLHHWYHRPSKWWRQLKWAKVLHAPFKCMMSTNLWRTVLLLLKVNVGQIMSGLCDPVRPWIVSLHYLTSLHAAELGYPDREWWLAAERFSSWPCTFYPWPFPKACYPAHSNYTSQGGQGLLGFLLCGVKMT